jgi:hypothetical protein
MTKIYTLSDPFTNEIRYVGKTKYSLNDRLCKHMITYEKNHRANWIRKLAKLNAKPIIKLLEEVSDDEWVFTEIYWIEQFRQWGFKLLNATKGGESGIISPQCREACIKANKGKSPSIKNIEVRIKNTSKPVIQYDVNMIKINEYPSASEAARQVGGNLSHITECCNGKLNRKTHKGFIWKYK